MVPKRKPLVCTLCKLACRDPAALVRHVDEAHVRPLQKTENGTLKMNRAGIKPLDLDADPSPVRLGRAKSFDLGADKVLEISLSDEVDEVAKCLLCDGGPEDGFDKSDGFDENDNDCSAGTKRKREPSSDDEVNVKRANLDDVFRENAQTAPAVREDVSQLAQLASMDSSKFYGTGGKGPKVTRHCPPPKPETTKRSPEMLSNKVCDKSVEAAEADDSVKSPKQTSRASQAATREAYLRALKSASKEEARQQFKPASPVFVRSVAPPKWSPTSLNKKCRVVATSPVRPSAKEAKPTSTPSPSKTPPTQTTKKAPSSPQATKSGVKKSLLYRALLNSFLKSQPGTPRPSSGAAASLLKAFRASRKCLKFDEDGKNSPTREGHRRLSDPV